MPDRKFIHFCLENKEITYQLDLDNKLVYQLGENDNHETKKLVSHITFKVVEDGEVSDDEEDIPKNATTKYISYSTFEVRIYIV
jgi:hypothetical protein